MTGKHICEENKRLRKLKEDRVYMLNLVSATQFYELTDMLKGKKCYREPCIYDWCEDNPIFDETMNDSYRITFLNYGKIADLID